MAAELRIVIAVLMILLLAFLAVGEQDTEAEARQVVGADTGEVPRALGYEDTALAIITQEAFLWERVEAFSFNPFKVCSTRCYLLLLSSLG